MLILRGENGFIRHHRKSNMLDASRSIYDIFSLQFSNGAYHIKGHGVIWWCHLLIGSPGGHINMALTLSILLCRCQRPLLVREQRRAGVLWRRGARGLLPGAARTRTPRHPRPQRQIPAWRPGRNAEGGRTRAEQLRPLGVLNSSGAGLQEEAWAASAPSLEVKTVRLGALGLHPTPGRLERTEVSDVCMATFPGLTEEEMMEGATHSWVTRGQLGSDILAYCLNCKWLNLIQNINMKRLCWLLCCTACLFFHYGGLTVWKSLVLKSKNQLDAQLVCLHGDRISNTGS